ncbi:MAG: hypothetical protein NZ108_08040 [Bacteroidia bacterium]|nr:hypothetical protein [Bacteroidia bacterium]
MNNISATLLQYTYIHALILLICAAISYFQFRSNKKFVGMIIVIGTLIGVAIMLAGVFKFSVSNVNINMFFNRSGLNWIAVGTFVSMITYTIGWVGSRKKFPAFLAYFAGIIQLMVYVLLMFYFWR